MKGLDARQAMARGDKQLELHVGSVTFDFVRIEPGVFQMGSPLSEKGHMPNEEPTREVYITKPFYLGRYEVTQAQYKAVMGVNPSYFEGDSLAVDQVTYPHAIEFCKKLSQVTGVNASLPTEAQWEYACRAGTTTRFYSGDTTADLDRVAWYAANSGDTVHPVGLKQPNAWGLYDMLGNVWELCADFIESYEQMDASDPVGDVYDNRGAMRGGGYAYPEEYCRAATHLVSNLRFGGTGVRVVINP